MYSAAMIFKKKHRNILLVHAQPIEELGGAELSLKHYVENAPAGMNIDVILPDDPVNLKQYDTVVLCNLRPSGGLGEKAEFRWAKEWADRLKGFLGHLVRLEQDAHPCTYRDARCVNFQQPDKSGCDCTSPIPAAFERLYNICDTLLFVSPMHRQVINQIINIQIRRQFDIASPIDFDRFRSVTPWEERKHAALITGDALRVADNAVALAEAEGYPIEQVDYLSVPYEQMPDLLNQYKAVVVAPAILHAFARLVVEAMACGCQVITNDRVGATSYDDPVSACRNSNTLFWDIIRRPPLWRNHRRFFGKLATSA
jgi:hypothetical protein